GGRISDRLTLSEMDAIRYQVEQNWNYNAGGRSISQMVVTIQVFITPDGTVTGTQALPDPAWANDPFYAALTRSAVAAINRASPLPIPASKWDVFQNGFQLRFNPTGIIDQ
ncbi:MAG: cell envelope integrity protein TolA, partial [Rhodospirillaceae bacterium]